MTTILLPWPDPPATQNQLRRLHYQAEAPCERCVIVPTPDGRCICREAQC